MCELLEITEAVFLIGGPKPCGWDGKEEGKVDPAPELSWALSLTRPSAWSCPFGCPHRDWRRRLSVLGVTKGSYDDWLWRADLKRKQCCFVAIGSMFIYSLYFLEKGLQYGKEMLLSTEFYFLCWFTLEFTWLQQAPCLFSCSQHLGS